MSNVMKGTIKWEWNDDHGKIHRFIIPNSYYVPAGSVRLLSPQHWAQTQIKNGYEKKNGIGCDTRANSIKLYWNEMSNSLTVPISKINNVATFHMAAGYNRFSLFCEQAEINYEEEMNEPMICMDADVEKQARS